MANYHLLVDGNSLGYASQQAMRLTCGDMETQAAYGMIKTLRQAMIETPEYNPFVLWDGRADWRFALHPDYKSSRRDTPEKVAMKESYAKQKPYIQRLLQYLGVRQMTAFKMEADDLAGYFVAKLSADPDNMIGLLSGDGDWVQLVRKNVWWKDPRDDAKFINAANFYDKTGCRTPLEYLEIKILTGDTSDCISGVGGLGDKGAPEFIAEFGSMRNFWMMCAKGDHKPKGKTQKRLLGACEHDLIEYMKATYMGDEDDSRARQKHADTWPGQGRILYKRNFQLMQLLRVAPPSKSETQIIAPAFDKGKFAEVCEELAFGSILKNLDEFVKPFQK
jgi:5'-3' exonuclease